MKTIFIFCGNFILNLQRHKKVEPIYSVVINIKRNNANGK